MDGIPKHKNNSPNRWTNGESNGQHKNSSTQGENSLTFATGAANVLIWGLQFGVGEIVWGMKFRGPKGAVCGLNLG